MKIAGENNLMKVAASATVRWPFDITSDANKAKMSILVETGPDPESGPEWTVILHDSADGEIWDNSHEGYEVTVALPGNNAKRFELEVISPNGARYGDFVKVKITMEGDDGFDSTTFEAVAQQSIMILKTQMDQEKTVAMEMELVEAKSKIKDIYAILSPPALRGYVFVEGMNTSRLPEKAKEVKKAKSFLTDKKRETIQEVGISEVSPYLTPVSTVEGIVEGDIVELINGPFKGEKARVQQRDPSKEEITVELIEAMVPIPVTVKGDSVRLLEKEK